MNTKFLFIILIDCCFKSIIFLYKIKIRAKKRLFFLYINAIYCFLIFDLSKLIINAISKSYRAFLANTIEILE